MKALHTHFEPGRRWNWRLWLYGMPLLELSSGGGPGLVYDIPHSEDEDGGHPKLHVDVWLLQAFITLPWRHTFPFDVELAEGCMASKRWGFHLHCSSELPYLFLYYGGPDWGRGEGKKLIEMPWSWGSCVRHEILTDPETHPYTYTLTDGTVQHRQATIQAEEREWRRPWIPCQRVDRYIDVRFDGEVGERTGSWKGGTIGCGYTMNPGERPVDTLRRMERERVFR